MTRRLSILAALALLTAAPALPAGSATERNNPFGIMCLLSGNDHTNGLVKHFELARELCGEWAYVRTGWNSTTKDTNEALRLMAAVRSQHLIPVISVLNMPPSYYHDSDLRQPKMEQVYDYWRDWVKHFHDQGILIPYLELGNELNGVWDAEIYARYCIEVSRALKSVDPRSQFVTAGMAGNGEEFYDEMLTKVPELKDHVDYWGLHPYPANHPPDFDPIFENDHYCVRSYEPLARLLKRHGVAQPEFVMTETGWELGVGKDRRFPRITQENRTEYIARAYEAYWRDDPTVRALMPFVLMDVNFRNWNGWDFVNNDWTKTPMFEAMAALEKPAGEDYLPAGAGEIRGRVAERQTELPVAKALVYAIGPDAALYAAATDEDGWYRLAGLPVGKRYQVGVIRDGYASPGREGLDVPPLPVDHVIAVVRTSYILAPLGRGGAISAGYTPYSDAVAALDLQDLSAIPVERIYAADETVQRDGRPTQRIQSDPGSKRGLWAISNYNTVLPGAAYRAQVWVKTRGLRRDGRGGARLIVEMTDSDAVPFTSTQAALGQDGDVDWTPLSVVIPSYPLGRRIKVSLEVDAAAGQAWFSDLVLHEAHLPTPEEAAHRRVHRDSARTGLLTGAVAGRIEPAAFSPEGRRVQDAIVTAEPGGYFTRTMTDGRYEFRDLPAGLYTLRAHAPGWDSGVVEQVVLAPGKDLRQDILLSEPACPAELQNPGFEAPGQTWPIAGWTRFGSIDGCVDDGWHKGLGIRELPDGIRTRGGKRMFASLAGSNVKNGGLYQTIQVEPHALYEVSCWTWTYQSADGIRYDVLSRLGVDPLGGTEVESPYVQWTPAVASHLEWTRISLQVRPVLAKMTIFLHHIQIEGITFNANAFDDVEVRKIGEAEPGSLSSAR